MSTVQESAGKEASVGGDGSPPTSTSVPSASYPQLPGVLVSTSGSRKAKSLKNTLARAVRQSGSQTQASAAAASAAPGLTWNAQVQLRASTGSMEEDTMAMPKCGWLYRRTLHYSWKRRWFVLEGCWLSFYGDPSLATPYGHINITTCRVQLKSSNEQEFIVFDPQRKAIYFKQNSQEKVITNWTSNLSRSWRCVLRAATLEEKEGWVIALVNNIVALHAGKPRQQFLMDAGEDDDADSFLSAMDGKDDDHDAITDPFVDDEGDDMVPGGASPSGGGGSSGSPFDQLVYTWERTDREKALMRELVEYVGSAFDPATHTDSVLLRFLRAREYNIPAAALLFKNFVAWHAENRPDLIQLGPDLVPVLQQRFAYLVGIDKDGQPAVMMYPARINTRDAPVDHVITFILYCVESATKLMAPPVEKFTIIVDFTGFGMSSVDRELIKKACFVLGNYYPERMAASFLLNYPFIVNTIWAMMKPWIEERTRRKVQFISKPRQLLNFFEADQLPVSLGGVNNYMPADGSIGLEHFMALNRLSTAQ